MAPEHKHQYRGYADDDTMLICTVPGCNTMARIEDLLRSTERRGVEIGRWQISNDLLGRTAMLTRRGRVAVNSYLSEHPLTRNIELARALQIRLIPTTLKKERQP